MDFSEACRVKWAHGVKTYRVKASDPFAGYLPEEAIQECVDLHNLLGKMEKEYGVNLSIQKGMCYQVAMTVKAQHKRLTGQ